MSDLLQSVINLLCMVLASVENRLSADGIQACRPCAMSYDPTFSVIDTPFALFGISFSLRASFSIETTLVTAGD